MRTCLFLVFALTLILGFYASSLDAFELKYPGERGFYIGIPISYIIVNESNTQNIGKEGTFTFGYKRINIDGVQYYECAYETPAGVSNSYLRLDSVNETLIQKGFNSGLTEISLEPAIKSIDYPISPNISWNEITELTAKNIEIPGLGKLNIPLVVKGVKVNTKVFSSTIKVPSGTFDTLLVESIYSGSLMGIPITLIQRTWLNIENITIKRNFEFVEPTKSMVYDIELSQSTITPVNPSHRLTSTWANIKKK